MLFLQEEWLPNEVAQGCGGRELTAVSILGPYLAITVFTEDDSTVAEKFFSEKPNPATLRSLTTQLQTEMDLLRVNLFKIFTFKFHPVKINNLKNGKNPAKTF